MDNLTRTTDSKARVSLPHAFANTTVVIEQVSDSELRIRKAQIVPDDEMKFYEETAKPLSDRDRDIFLASLEKPPSINKALRKAIKNYKQRHG
jgi:hypothetical protein